MRTHVHRLPLINAWYIYALVHARSTPMIVIHHTKHTDTHPTESTTTAKNSHASVRKRAVQSDKTKKTRTPTANHNHHPPPSTPCVRTGAAGAAAAAAAGRSQHPVASGARELCVIVFGEHVTPVQRHRFYIWTVHTSAQRFTLTRWPHTHVCDSVPTTMMF